MRQEVKEQWVADLRSGNFKQGRMNLKATDGTGDVCHCQAGVLAEQAVSSGATSWEGENRMNGGVRYGVLASDGGFNTAFPSDAVLEWAGITSYDDMELVWDAVRLNDRGDSFETIADFIEEKF